jgi:glycine cleavage system H protein
MSGEVTEVNDVLSDSPEQINEAPYGGGWLVKVTLSSPEEYEALLTAAEYEKLLDR